MDVWTAEHSKQRAWSMNIRSRKHGQRAWNDNRIWIITLEYSDYGVQELFDYGFEDFDTKLVYTQTVVVGTERWFRGAVS